MGIFPTINDNTDLRMKSELASDHHLMTRAGAESSKLCAGKTPSGNSETVALLSGRTFAGTFMVALSTLGWSKRATYSKSVSDYAKKKNSNKK